MVPVIGQFFENYTYINCSSMKIYLLSIISDIKIAGKIPTILFQIVKILREPLFEMNNLS